MKPRLKIALVMNDDFSIWHFRKGLMSTLVARGFDVSVITPPGPYVARIESLGTTHIAVPMERFISPASDIALVFRLFRLFRRKRFDIIHTMTVKPNVYGTIAAKLAGVPRIVGLVSGAGFAFSGGTSFGQRILKALVSGLFKLAFSFTSRVWFQNGDDLAYFVEEGLLAKSKALLIKSGGINLDEYSSETVSEASLKSLSDELKAGKTEVRITMISARMVKSKGVEDFLKAARLLAPKYPQAFFLLVGPLENDSPEAVPEEVLKTYESDNVRLILNFRTDVKELIASSDVVVLPSYYKEGVPRVLLEALAFSKPVVTTDSVGCREVVDDGKNGFIIPIKDPQALADALEKLINSREMRENFGAASRIKGEREFDEKEVVRRIIQELYGVT